ncbi:MAG: hypothetical protein PHX34_04140 [Candidatus Shapirobacteria bacterium]|nr:hypothetical protein [Candidatus Shapirobacteria bacterium]
MVKEKKIHFTFKTFIRLLIFGLIIYFSINWFSNNKKSSVLGDTDITLFDEETKNNFIPNIYQKLPEGSRYQLEHLNETKIGIFFQDKFSFLQSQLNGFPNRQIKEIQKSIIKNVSDDMIENIDKN